MKMSKKYKGLPAWLDQYDLKEIVWNEIRVFVGILPTSVVKLNEGQLEGLPRNPREWNREELDNLKVSLEETPQLYLGRNILTTFNPKAEELVALGGNMRLFASMEMNYPDVQVTIYPEETTLETKLEIVIKDNNSWGRYDWDAITTEWSDKPLEHWNTPVWNTGDSSSGGSGGSSSSGSEAGSTTSQRLLLQFNNKKIQMSEAEFEALCARYDAHVAKVGASFGFVAALLGMDAEGEGDE